MPWLRGRGCVGAFLGVHVAVDVLVSFIQAYVFTMLSTIFISLAQESHDSHGHEEHTAHEAANTVG